MKNHNPPLMLSVVIPVYKEGPTIAAFVDSVVACLTHLLPNQAEIIVVDDASPEPVEIGSAQGPIVVHLIRRQQRGGSGAARKTGIAQAEGEWIAWIDGDGTYPIEGLAKIWLARTEADQIIGARSCDHGMLSGVRLSVKRFACLWAGLRWKMHIPDLNSGLRLMRRRCSDQWSEFLPDGFSCTTTATLAALALGQSIQFVAIPYCARTTGSKSKFNPISDTYRLLRVINRWKPNRQLARM